MIGVRILLGAALLCAAALAACGAQARAPAFGSLDVRFHQLPATTFHSEGAAWHVRVTNRIGSATARVFDAETLTENRFVLRRLLPGKYALISFRRPCDGNCSLLDGPTDRCSAPVSVRARVTTRAVVEQRGAGDPCTIRIVR